MGNPYPKAIFCIIATEFCERFSFCGLRTILSLYLRNELLFHENTATVVYHIFIMVCYIIPISGAIFADSFFGRYRTILYFSIIYLIGNILMCLAATPPLQLPQFLFTVLGLSLIAVGTGGIKPCVAAFGGDQFVLPEQEDLLQQFFSIFYFTINFGGFVGMILTPMLRKGVTCFGDDTCYSLGFGFPALLMLLSLLLFVLGKPWYRMKMPRDNIIIKFIRCTGYALMKKIKNKDEKKKHWLDYAYRKYDAKLIKDMKIVFAILFLYIPLPLFWSLFDQQGSRWTFQASRMDGYLWGYQIVPDQMQVVNPAIVLILIPLFDKCLYPILEHIRWFQSPLHKMVAGGFMAGTAFLASGLLEIELEKTYPVLPDKGKAAVNFINTLPCDVDIGIPPGIIHTLQQHELYVYRNIIAHNRTRYRTVVNAPLKCGGTPFLTHTNELIIEAFEYQIDTVLIGINNDNAIALYATDPVEYKKSLSGKSKVRVAFVRGTDDLHSVTISLENSKMGLNDLYFSSDSPIDDLSVSTYMELAPGEYNCSVKWLEKEEAYTAKMSLELGAVYTIAIREYRGNVAYFRLYTMTPPNRVHMLWLIPQYFLISVAEIMFGISGLEFSFVQAPKCMKTITIAAWYLSVALGNFLVIIITQAKFFKRQAHEFFLFSAMIVADMIVFARMAANYKFVQLEADGSSCFVFEEATPLLETSPILEVPASKTLIPKKSTSSEAERKISRR